MEAREGRHRAFVTNAFRNTAPSRPMRSIFGVRSRLLPASDDSSQRTPSPKKKTRLGLGPVTAAAIVLSSCGLAAIAPAVAVFLRNVLRVRLTSVMAGTAL